MKHPYRVSKKWGLSCIRDTKEVKGNKKSLIPFYNFRNS